MNPPDTADNVENTVRSLGGGHGVLDFEGEAPESQVSGPLNPPLLFSPRAPRIPSGRSKSCTVGLLKWVPKSAPFRDRLRNRFFLILEAILEAKTGSEINIFLLSC